MRQILAILPLTLTACTLAQPTVLPETPLPTETWSAEFVNTDAAPPRELVVKAWYPVIQADEHWPLILLAPGRGVPSIAYARVGQYLASHGFVVVGIDSPGTGRQSFADGRVVPPDPALKPPPGLMAGPYIEVDRFFANASQASAGDLSYILDQIAAGETVNEVPFADRIDTDRVGLLGHSLGGRIAGAFAARDRRAVAWVGVEGLAPRAARRQGLGMPAMAILSAGIWPYAIANVRELAWCGQDPTYFVKMVGIEHNTITDDNGDGPAITMQDNQRRLARTIRVFFEHHMSDPDTVLENWPEGISVERRDTHPVERPAEHLCDD